MTDVLIAGCGPTGLTLAIELTLRGISVRILDRRTGPHHESRGKGLNTSSLEVFDRLGVAERIHARGTCGLVLRKYYDGAHINDSPSGDGVLIGQWQTEEILRDRLADLGVRVEYGTEIVGIDQSDDGVTARLADGSTVRAGFLAGCDGGGSTTRKSLGIPFEGYTDDTQMMVIGDVTAPGLSRDRWHQWFTSDGGGVMLCPIPGTDSFQFQGSPEVDEHGEPLPPSLESFQRLFDRHAGTDGIRLAEPTWLSVWRVNVRMAPRLREGRVFLAGDAAHVHPIAGGLGMNTGVLDAAALGRTLVSALTGEAGREGEHGGVGEHGEGRRHVLDGYEAERLPAAAAVLADTAERYTRVVAAVREPGRGTEAGMEAAMD
ncbi:FAD-dependent monooxygenase [Streptomyces sp. NPDC101733]|uniref:FAD-dependent monooxygenase n=1 Tax=unclassified Streptomyces TaxID=2593676 RepID=UPI003820A127